MNTGCLRAGIALIPALLFFGALFWAKSRDPFERIWFTVTLGAQGKAKCAAILPKTVARPLPVVVYFHDSGGSLLGSGTELRRMAEMGLAAVGMEYDQTNEIACRGQFSALQRYLERQDWVDTNAVAWVGFGLGAQRQMSFLLEHPELQPKLLVRVAGGWVAELEKLALPPSNPSSLNQRLSTVLLIHGAQDSSWPIADVQRVAAAFRINGVPVDQKIVEGQSHGLEPNREVIFRGIAEYCLTRLKSREALKNYRSITMWQSQAKPLWVYWIPAFAWIGAWFYWLARPRFKPSAANRSPHSVVSPTHAASMTEKPGGRMNLADKLGRWERGWRWLAAILATVAICQTALHLIPPRLAISHRILAVARKHLIQPKERPDFDSLANDPLWQGKRLSILLTHVELANYNRELVNWKINDKVYREFVLSPLIEPGEDREMDWRRQLWESFYPRVHKEQSPETAAKVVVRHLRERVTIAGDEGYPGGVQSGWLNQITTTRGFERIYVAALRSAGIPARLDAQGKAEFWSEPGWRAAPRPLGALLCDK